LLAPLHGLAAEYGKVLHAAAILHEVGSFISRAGRRRHSHYILAHSELFGFSQPHRRLMAAMTRYVGRSKITPAHPAVRMLAPPDRLLLPRLVMLLRLARAVERGRRGAVLSFRVKLEPSNVRVTLVARPSGAELELWALEQEKAYFLEVFGRELSCAEV
jgi:exopolyphosphatase / guanosine-5'-triphosphate,3'-diphosphate pyrophosphatase